MRGRRGVGCSYYSTIMNNKGLNYSSCLARANHGALGNHKGWSYKPKVVLLINTLRARPPLNSLVRTTVTLTTPFRGALAPLLQFQAGSLSLQIENLICLLSFSHNDFYNLRGQPPMPKPDAANPRQVDAILRDLSLINPFCFFKKLTEFPSRILETLLCRFNVCFAS